MREDTLAIPTYRVTGENPNPVFESRYGVAHIYPYSLQDEFSAQKEVIDHRVVILENEYLRATILPDLGGRVWSLFDKVAEREVFYRNSVVKLAMLAIRGAFFSGGLEFSFPVAHSPSTAAPVQWVAQSDGDSASVTVGGIEHISNMEWSVTLTLVRGACALAQDVMLFNPGPLPGRYHYWSNASLEANEGTEFCYPMRRFRSYEFTGTAGWPFARVDLIQGGEGLPGMEGVPMWPSNNLQHPFNLRWQHNVLGQLSAFGRDVEWPFFGAWQHDGDYGYAHLADPRDVAGMKLWSWGTSEVGRVNQRALSDDPREYAETQCGAMETQLDFRFLQPGESRSWREWWLPFRGLGGLTWASVDVGAKVGLSPDGPGWRLEVALCPVRELADVELAVEAGGERFEERIGTITPREARRSAFALRRLDLSGSGIKLRVASRGGVLLDYTHSSDPEPDGEQPLRGAGGPEETEAPSGSLAAEVDRLLTSARRFENFDDLEGAREAYRNVLKLAPEHGFANCRMGLLCLRRGDYDAAHRHLVLAESSCVDEATYYRGVCQLRLGCVEEAQRLFQRVDPLSPLGPEAAVQLGRLAAAKGKWPAAHAQGDRAAGAAGSSGNAPLLRAIALARSGHTEEARTELTAVLRHRPLSLLAASELARLDEGSGAAGETLERLLAVDEHYPIDLAIEYRAAGLPREAVSVLRGAYARDPRPLTAYLLALLSVDTGDEDQAAAWLDATARGAASPKGRSLLVSPARLEELEALRLALARNPSDALAAYGLGVFSFAHGDYETARGWLETAEKNGLVSDVLLRNLGMLSWRVDGDLEGAAARFERALELNRENYDLYLHLDALYAQQGLARQRGEVLRRMMALPRPREDIRKRIVVALVELGRSEEAVRFIAAETFVPMEMDQSFHDAYVAAHLLEAKRADERGDLDGAIEGYRKALAYPASVGVGRPLKDACAEIHYRLGCAYEKAGRLQEALDSWWQAACEHHMPEEPLYRSIQKSLDKLGRYSELGLERVARAANEGPAADAARRPGKKEKR